jgi:K+-sensing histidine kinase KdpD
MSQEVLNRVFNSSEHYSTFGTNNERGTGLGIKLCKEMLKRNNGSICPESKVNSGTIIYVALPIAKHQQSA